MSVAPPGSSSRSFRRPERARKYVSRWRSTPRSSAPSSRHAASERAGSGSIALSSTLKRGADTGGNLLRSAVMEGATVVDHVLLQRLVSILRDRTTPHGVFRQTLDDAG